jgi:CRISPR-associated endonuclease/helicase Cas3
MTDYLLAKSKPQISLEKHLLDTDQAGKAIFRDRILSNWLQFFKLTEADQDQFLLFLSIAALAHDLGKANEEFQRMISGEYGLKQSFRHEWLSALLLHWLRSWLTQSELLKTDWSFEIITAAVLGHHLSVSIAPKTADKSNYWLGSRTSVRKIVLNSDSQQVHSILDQIANLLNLEEIIRPELPAFLDLESPDWQKILKEADRTGKSSFKKALAQPSSPDILHLRALHLAVKAALIPADTAASGIVREQERLGRNIDEWIREQLHKPCLTLDDLERDILQPRYRKIEQKTGRPFKLHDFQIGAESLGDRALLLAGCGRGKTLAAYLWAKGVIRRRKIGRIVFLYPTRATATEGFKDYIQEAPETDAALLHGTSAYELEKLADVPDDPNTGSQKRKDFQPDPRLYALGLWGRRYFSATVDQFLSFLTFNYEATVLLPVLADAAIVLDEIHAYDHKMFRQLVAFLEAFDVPVLCMTATLAQSRREQLEGLGLEIYPNDPQAVEDLKKEEDRDRYSIRKGDRTEAERLVRQAYSENKRILWVVNTVDRCQKIAEKFQGLQPICYHSRFKLEDRQDRHEAVIEAFKWEPGQPKLPKLAITTQVCEMSLDLDADVLITELAPCSSLVQRFGRSNRHGYLLASEVLVYEPEKELPYTKEEFETARSFLDAICGEKRNQSFLTTQLEIFSPKEARSDGHAPFLTGGYEANGEPFRDIENWTKDCILQQDLDIVEAIARENIEAIKTGQKKKSWDQFVLPVPNSCVQPVLEVSSDTPLPRYLGVSTSGCYSSEYGFKVP